MGAGFFTSFFMLRMILVAFAGEPKNEAARHAHEGPFLMIAPMAVLALLSLVAGLFPIEKFLGETHEGGHAAWTLWISLILAVAGFIPAYRLYRNASHDPLDFSILRNKFYVDEFYQRSLVRTQDSLAKLLDAFEGWVVRGFLVRGSGVVARASGQGLRLVQCGQVQVYAAVFILGVFFLIGWLWRGGVVR
jgi:NADH-quinone oxidoreductase subunit L